MKVGRVEERKKGREEGSRRAYTTLHYITAARAANPKNRIESTPFQIQKVKTKEQNNYVIIKNL